MTDRPPLRFGLFIGQAGKSWARLLDDVLEAEALGYDHAWLVDHLTPTDGPPERPCGEAWTLLAALAARTSAIELGVLVTNNLFRHPALLAKEAATVDEISGGRAILGLGSGWFEPEHRRFGFALPPAGERVARLAEAAIVVRGLLDRERVTFAGRFYRVEDAFLDPAPVARPGRPTMPLLIAAHRPRTLAIAARLADIWDTFPATPGAATEAVTEDLATQAARFDELARLAGRDSAAIRRSTWTGVHALASENRFRRWVDEMTGLGFTDLTTAMPGPGARDGLRRIASTVIPELRRAPVTA